MKYLVIGSGGREHCIAWRLLNDGSADEVFAAPGNGGFSKTMRVNVAVDDFAGIAAFCKSEKIDMVAVGPEAPLAAGIADYLAEEKIPVFGPSKLAARIEGSKLFAKYIMKKYGVPTADYREFTDKDELLAFLDAPDTIFPMVIKLDGLAAGKGVGIPENREEAIAFVNENVKAGDKVFTEEFLSGEEASVLGISDGVHIKGLLPAQDHKRVFDGDKGPNTGGMGAYAPAPVVTPKIAEYVQTNIMEPVIAGLAKEGCPFKGVLYAGLMINGGDVRVLEFNARFGDPETQVILPLLKGKLGDIFWAAVNGTIDKTEIAFTNNAAITVVMAAGGYPKAYEKGKLISGIKAAEEAGALVFQAGTEQTETGIVSAGGRVLSVTAVAPNLQAAKEQAYNAASKISFDGAHLRKDIGHRALG